MLFVIQYRKKFEMFQTQKNLLLEQQKEKQEKKDKIQKNLDALIKAKYILSDISKSTQENLIDYIESMVTKIIQGIFNRELYFLVNAEIKRNKAEISFKLFEGNKEDRCVMLNNSFIPSQEYGGGSLDVISFALRLVIYSLEEKSSRNVMMLDEPFKNLGGMMLERCAQMLKELSEELNIQFIITTHSPLFASYANKAFFVVHDKTKSLVAEIKPESILEVSLLRYWEEKLTYDLFGI